MAICLEGAPSRHGYFGPVASGEGKVPADPIASAGCRLVLDAAFRETAPGRVPRLETGPTLPQKSKQKRSHWRVPLLLNGQQAGSQGGRDTSDSLLGHLQPAAPFFAIQRGIQPNNRRIGARHPLVVVVFSSLTLIVLLGNDIRIRRITCKAASAQRCESLGKRENWRGTAFIAFCCQ
jgi:hypothetical protein